MKSLQEPINSAFLTDLEAPSRRAQELKAAGIRDTQLSGSGGTHPQGSVDRMEQSAEAWQHAVLVPGEIHK